MAGYVYKDNSAKPEQRTPNANLFSQVINAHVCVCVCVCVCV